MHFSIHLATVVLFYSAAVLYASTGATFDSSDDSSLHENEDKLRIIDEELRRKDEWAIKLQDAADAKFSLFRASICEDKVLKLPTPDLVFWFAITAVKCPHVSWGRHIAKAWAEWWDADHALLPFDTRSNADRFLVYALQRRSRKLADSKSITDFEKKLVEMFEATEMYL